MKQNLAPDHQPSSLHGARHQWLARSRRILRYGFELGSGEGHKVEDAVPAGVRDPKYQGLAAGVRVEAACARHCFNSLAAGLQ